MRIEEIRYEVDGTEMIGTYAVDEYRRGTRPGVLVCHEGNGLGPHVKGRAVRLASLGYAAFALDYLGGGQPLDLAAASARLLPLMGDGPRTRALGHAGLDILLAQPEVDRERVGVMGFCFGGLMSLELACDGADLKAVIGFHPGLALATPEDATSIRGSVLMFCGADDPLIPKDQRDGFEAAMTAGQVADWRMEVLGSIRHSFTNVEADELGMAGLAYDERSDRRCWASAVALLQETLGPTPA